jgi:hypothetical protein
MILKLFTFLLFFSIFGTIREIYILSKDIRKKQNYRITTPRLLMFGASLSYILTIIFTGL